MYFRARQSMPKRWSTAWDVGPEFSARPPVGSLRIAVWLVYPVAFSAHISLSCFWNYAVPSDKHAICVDLGNIS